MATQDEIRSLYPHIASGFVHLNHAGVSPLNTNAIEKMHEFNVRQSEDPAGAFTWMFEQWQECRDRLSRFMGVCPDDIAFTKNTAHGVSILANGLDWKAGDEVVFSDSEYPANTYPWIAQSLDRGVNCKVVKTRSDGTVPVEDYEKLTTARTRIIAVSWVQFATGFMSDIKALSDLAHSVGAYLAVDVIQGLGGFPIDLTELGVDAAATGSQKWLMGPMGVGGLYIKPNMLEHMRLVNVGALSVKNVHTFDPLDLDVKPSAQRYEEGTPNINGYVGLNESLKLIEGFGIENAAKNILDITHYAASQLTGRGYLVDSPMQDRMRSGILMFHHPSVSGEELSAKLVGNKINVVLRGGKLRFAPHLYTTKNDIDRALDALTHT